jgi:hypothetical protein
MVISSVNGNEADIGRWKITDRIAAGAIIDFPENY